MNRSNFIAALTERLSQYTFPDTAKQSAAMQVAASLAQDSDIFVSGELRRGKAATGQSKVGGRPDVMAQFEWPCEDDDPDSPLAFLAQINLAEVRPHDVDGRLPAKGMLWFFSIADGNRAYGQEIDESTTAVRFSADPGPLVAHDIPESLADDEDALIKERKIEFGPAIRPGVGCDRYTAKLIDKMVKELGGRNGAIDMLCAPDSADGTGAVVLADFDGYAIAPNAFGEGFLGFVLSAENLAQGELAKAETVFVLGT